MTIRPKVRRFHTSTHEPASNGEASIADTANRKPTVRVEVRKKTPEQVSTASDAQTANTAAGENAAISERERMMRTDPVDDGFGNMRLTDSGQGQDSQASGPQEKNGNDREAKLDSIRKEKLSDRQLRIARRIAALHQIKVTTDEEAVLELRERGIDPSHREALKRILTNEGAKAGAAPAPNAPAIRPTGTVPAMHTGAQLPAQDLSDERRAAEIYRIQQDMARRRRRRLGALVMRLLLFVILPTIAVGVYYFSFASPLYSTYSQFQIQRADGGGGMEGASLFSSSPLANNTDSVAVQGYLTSREAMNRLNEDLNFKNTYQDPALDPIRRLSADATNEEAYKVYKDSVKIGYDPTEGLVNMEVIAPDPELSKAFSLALIGYAEEEVDKMTSRVRDDQMQGATENYKEAEAAVLAAQRRVQELQTQLGVLDPVAESTVVMGQISQLEAQLSQKRLELGQLQANPTPLPNRVEALRGDITRLQDMINETRSQLTEGGGVRESPAAISRELRMAAGE